MDVLWPTCLAPRTTGTMHSGSVACVLSSIKMERNCILASLGSPAPTHVQQMTSAFWGREPGLRTPAGQGSQTPKGRQDGTQTPLWSTPFLTASTVQAVVILSACESCLKKGVVPHDSL